MMDREVLHQRILTRLTAVDWESNDHKDRRLQTHGHNDLSSLSSL